MSAIDWAEVRRLFDAVCELPPEQWREALRAAGASAAVADEVLALCDAQTRGIGLPQPVAALLANLDPELAPGTRLGPWRILSTLAEGGMGRVYLAERADGQYQLKVAIKRLRALGQPGENRMLERERQILADLAHPHIARLLDGGTSPNGQPHLVMEYIEGERIDRWCRAQSLDLPARLRLFQQVCRAVGHAHRHLILHCDLKPSNILVRADGSPVLLDFGIARLADSHDLQGQGYMTPRYASPEQKRGEALSAASDIYSLGLILSELVAPSDKDPQGDASTATPPTQPPSGRARRSGLAWAGRLRGDLDAIVMRACAAGPEQRHASAEALAEDIERYFERRPVSPLAHRRGYRLRRLLQRRWSAFAVGGVLLAMALGFTFSLQQQLQRAQAAERAARLEAESNRETVDFLLAVFEHADPEAGERADTTARELIDAARTELEQSLDRQPRLKLRLGITLGQIYERIGLPTEALALLRMAEGLAPRDLELSERLLLMDSLAHALNSLSRRPEALAIAESASALAEAGLPPEHPALANALNMQGLLLDADNGGAEALPMLERSLAIRLLTFGEDSVEVAATLHNLGLAARRSRQFSAAEVWLERSLAAKRTLFPDSHPRVLNTLEVLAGVYRDRGELARAAASLEQQRALRVRAHGADSTRVARVNNELGNGLHDLGRYSEAQVAYLEALRIHKLRDGEDSPHVALVVNNLASLLEDRGDLAGAEPLMRDSLRIRSAALGPEHLATARAHNNLGRVLMGRGELNAARVELERALDLRQRALSEPHVELLSSRLLLARLEARSGNRSAAEQHFESARAQWLALAPLDPLQRLRFLESEAELALAFGDSEGARTALDAALALARDALPPDHPRWAELVVRRARALAQDPGGRVELERAQRVLQTALVSEAPLLRDVRQGASGFGLDAP
jgi:serine/threonine-protein kinase